MSIETIARWLSALGTLTNNEFPVPQLEAEARIKAFSTMMVDRYQPWAFTRSSLEHVADASKRSWPNYGPLCAALSEWCRANMPSTAVPRLERPEEATPAQYQAQMEAEDRYWWEARLRGLAEHADANVRWLRAKETFAQVTQPDSAARPWIVPLLIEIIDQAEADGADMAQIVRAAVPCPKKPTVVNMYQPQRVPAQRSDAYA